MPKWHWRLVAACCLHSTCTMLPGGEMRKMMGTWSIFWFWRIAGKIEMIPTLPSLFSGDRYLVHGKLYLDSRPFHQRFHTAWPFARLEQCNQRRVFAALSDNVTRVAWGTLVITEHLRCAVGKVTSGSWASNQETNSGKFQENEWTWWILMDTSGH